MGASVVPFNRATVAPRQIQYLADSFASPRVAGDGPYTDRVVELVAAMLGHDRALLTPSCTSALEMSAVLAGLQPGDEVVVPSFTFVSSINAFVLFGAVPRFADVDAASFNVTVDSVRAVLSERTRAVVAVHYGGRPAPIQELRQLCDERGILLIEDCAHSIFASLDERHLGTFGDVATFSFHETKNISCGEGGMIVVNREDWWERARVVREKGTNRTRFLQGHVDKYTWVDIGSSYLLADPLASVLLAQLEFGDEIQRRRRLAMERYATDLAAWALEVGAQLPVTGFGVDAAHLYPILFPTSADRDRFISHCRDRGVTSVFHYLPLHESPMGRSLAPGQDCPVTSSVAGRLARLPVFSDITSAEVERVVEVASSFGGM